MKNKAKKVSKFVLWTILGITTIIALLFYFGGEVPEAQRIVYDLPQPLFTDVIIWWVIILFIAAILVIVTFTVYKYLKNYDDEMPRQRMVQFSSIGGLILLLLITWVIGDGSTLKIPGYTGTDNSAFWLKIADMWLYSICILILIATGLIATFGIRSYLNHRKEH